MRFKSLIVLIAVSFIALSGSSAKGEEVMAIAAGISPCVEEIMDLYKTKGGTSLSMVTGPCGALAKQAEAGAPYDLVMMSEPRWPNWMKGKGLLSDINTFAIGQLVLWSPKGDQPTVEGLKDHVIAIPDPEMTAYGMLAKNYLTSKGLWDSFISGKIVTAKSAPQAVMAVSGGAADWAFIPKSSALKAGGPFLSLEARMEQVGGLKPDASPSARAFWEFCRSKEANEIWLKWGFLLEDRR
nr:molybdate ABC transporter substrate-binding protein [uncultured Dethiosulfovibrio sp.]